MSNFSAFSVLRTSPTLWRRPRTFSKPILIISHSCEKVLLSKVNTFWNRKSGSSGDVSRPVWASSRSYLVDTARRAASRLRRGVGVEEDRSDTPEEFSASGGAGPSSSRRRFAAFSALSFSVHRCPSMTRTARSHLHFERRPGIECSVLYTGTSCRLCCCSLLLRSWLKNIPLWWGPGFEARPRSEEEAWNWVVVRSSTARSADFFCSSPVLRDPMPSRASCYVPEGTNVKKLCKWGVFPSQSEWRCAVSQTTSLWSWWERRMQKRQYCTWGTVFSPVPSEGKTAQGMDCEDL